MWFYISIILFWLLCGSWAIRMEEKSNDKVMRGGESFIVGSIGICALVIAICSVWIPRLLRFAKGIRQVWKQALKGK